MKARYVIAKPRETTRREINQSSLQAEAGAGAGTGAGEPVSAAPIDKNAQEKIPNGNKNNFVRQRCKILLAKIYVGHKCDYGVASQRKKIYK